MPKRKTAKAWRRLAQQLEHEARQWRDEALRREQNARFWRDKYEQLEFKVRRGEA